MSRRASSSPTGARRSRRSSSSPPACPTTSGRRRRSSGWPARSASGTSSSPGSSSGGSTRRTSARAPGSRATRSTTLSTVNDMAIRMLPWALGQAGLSFPGRSIQVDLEGVGEGTWHWGLEPRTSPPQDKPDAFINGRGTAFALVAGRRGGGHLPGRRRSRRRWGRGARDRRARAPARVRRVAGLAGVAASPTTAHVDNRSGWIRPQHSARDPDDVVDLRPPIRNRYRARCRASAIRRVVSVGRSASVSPRRRAEPILVRVVALQHVERGTARFDRDADVLGNEHHPGDAATYARSNAEL